jgi:DNA-binding response OmpR family regulator
MLTARATLQDRVGGLDVGADDYLTKPFGIEELFARIRAVMRRRKTTDSLILKVSDLVLDPKKHEVSRGGKTVQLTPKEYRLIELLMRNHGRALTRQELINAAWGPHFKETNNDLECAYALSPPKSGPVPFEASHTHGPRRRIYSPRVICLFDTSDFSRQFI